MFNHIRQKKIVRIAMTIGFIVIDTYYVVLWIQS